MIPVTEALDRSGVIRLIADYGNRDPGAQHVEYGHQPYCHEAQHHKHYGKLDQGDAALASFASKFDDIIPLSRLTLFLPVAVGGQHVLPLDMLVGFVAPLALIALLHVILSALSPACLPAL